MATARRAYAAGKPWLAVKAGRTEFGAAAAYSHTASLAGSYEAFAAACRDCGVLTLDDPDAMMLLAASINHYPDAQPDKIAIVTTSGGGGAIAADRLTDRAIPIASFTSETVKALSELYPANAAKANPVDMGTANEGGSMVVGKGTIKALIEDSASSLILSAITTAPDVELLCRMFDRGTREAKTEGFTKPNIIVLQQGHSADAAREFLREQGTVYTDTLDDAIRAIEAWRRLASVKPSEAPARPSDLAALDASGLAGSVGEAEAKAFLAVHGVPVNRGEMVDGSAAAENAAARMQGPFVVKVASPDIVHKSDVGGVALGLEDAAAVATAVKAMQARIAERMPSAKIDGFLVQEMRSGKLELLIGARNDSQFGPMVIVGAGGVLVELLKDVAVARAPVDEAGARAMLESLQIASLMKGYRGGKALDMAAVTATLSRVSWIVAGLGEQFLELDINPLLVDEDGEGCIAVDARILMRDN
jgi:acetyl-CoA synthetase (ADP-forming)